jgi:acyl dehydratase
MTVSLDVVKAAIGTSSDPITFTFTTRDTVIYALGVGAPANWLDQDELKFVYELHDDFVALPTMPAIYTGELITETLKGDFRGIKFNPMMLVHGEQSLEIKKPLPVSGTMTCKSTVSDIFDKGSGMLINTDVSCVDESGDEIAIVSSSMFIRGLGGFGGERGTSEKIVMPEREPDKVYEEKTLEKQALIYRLSGDINPLHADPSMAQIGNFETPILHGLSTYGFAGRAVLKHFAENDPRRFKSMSGRFTKEVYPGETLITEMWETDDCVMYQTKAKERDVVVLGSGKVVVS